MPFPGVRRPWPGRRRCCLDCLHGDGGGDGGRDPPGPRSPLDEPRPFGARRLGALPGECGDTVRDRGGRRPTEHHVLQLSEPEPTLQARRGAGRPRRRRPDRRHRRTRLGRRHRRSAPLHPAHTGRRFLDRSPRGSRRPGGGASAGGSPAGQGRRRTGGAPAVVGGSGPDGVGRAAPRRVRALRRHRRPDGRRPGVRGGGHAAGAARRPGDGRLARAGAARPRRSAPPGARPPAARRPARGAGGDRARPGRVPGQQGDGARPTGGVGSLVGDRGHRHRGVPAHHAAHLVARTRHGALGDVADRRPAGPRPGPHHPAGPHVRLYGAVLSRLGAVPGPDRAPAPGPGPAAGSPT